MSRRQPPSIPGGSHLNVRIHGSPGDDHIATPPGGHRPLDARRPSLERVREGLDDRGIELGAAAGTELGDRGLGGRWRAVWAVARHGVERVADEHDPRGERDRVAGQAVRVAVAVDALVRRAYDAGDRAERRGARRILSPMIV